MSVNSGGQLHTRLRRDPYVGLSCNPLRILLCLIRFHRSDGFSSVTVDDLPYLLQCIEEARS
jgi:hypothetical protein